MALLTNHRLCDLEQRTRHAREQVVLDLVVQATEHEVDQRSPVTSREVSTCLCRWSRRAPAAGINMPLWLGAKAIPRLSPNNALCTRAKDDGLGGVKNTNRNPK